MQGGRGGRSLVAILLVHLFSTASSSSSSSSSTFALPWRTFDPRRNTGETKTIHINDVGVENGVRRRDEGGGLLTLPLRRTYSKYLPNIYINVLYNGLSLF